MSLVASIVLLVVLTLLLMALAAAEAALTNISQSRAEALEEDDVPGAELLVEQLLDRNRVVSPILLLALSAQMVAAAVLAIAVDRQWGGQWVPLAVFVQIGLLFVFAESVPKFWGLHNIDRAAIGSARLVSVLQRIPPVRWLLSALLAPTRLLLGHSQGNAVAVTSEEEVIALADAAVAADVLDDSEGEIIHSLVEFGDTLVREAMVPRPDVLAVADETSVDDAIAQMVERGVSRMPVYGADIDDVRGIVHIKDLFARVQRGRGSHFVSIAQRQPYFVPESKRAAELLRELKGLPDSMVVVVDEYGGTAGIVTMEDLIEEILGEIVDEFDAAEEPMLEPLRVGQWRVHGRMPVDEFNDLLGADLPDDDWDTVGGLIFDVLGHVPDPGEEIVVAGYKLTVERVEGRRITRVRVIEAPTQLSMEYVTE
jgi:CBS domain containing-hemolysin-like protein